MFLVIVAAPFASDRTITFERHTVAEASELAAQVRAQGWLAEVRPARIDD